MSEILDFNEEQTLTKTFFHASKGKRFANYFIDIITYYLLAFVVGIFLGLLALAIGREDIFLDETPPDITQRLIEIILGLILLAAYYTFCEYYFKGKTLGKVITKTRTVTLDNRRIDMRTAFIRSLCRLVPFEAFSFLRDEPGGWHDEWSNTKVIDDDGWHDIGPGF